MFGSATRPPTAANPFATVFYSERAFPWRAFVIALALRLVLVIAMRHLTIGLDDMFQYDMLARSIATGNGYRWYAADDLHHVQAYFQTLDFKIPADYDPRGVLTSFRPPLYPALLALIYSLTGIDPDRFFTARIVQAFLNAALVPLTWFLARRLFPDQPRVARWAAWVVAFYPLLVMYPLALATENLFFVLVMISLVLLTLAAQTRQTRYFLLAGFCLGLTALTRSVILAFGALTLLWVFFGLRERRKALVMALFLVLTISPWVIRNSLLYGRLAGIETALGYDLYMGYYPQSTGSFEFGPSLDLMPMLDDEDRDQVGLQKALQFIKNDPGRVPLLMVYRAGHFFGLERRALTYFYSNNFFGFIPLPLLLLIGILVMSPFVIISCSAGFGLALMRWDRATLILPLVILGYVAPHVALLAEERFHYTLIPVFAILAALFWDTGLKALRLRWQESHIGKLALSLAALAVLLLCANWTYELLRDAARLSLLLGPNGNQTYFSY